MSSPPADPNPTIHILSKTNYTTHHLISLPSTSLPPLAPSSIRIRSKILGLTTNNLTYASLGHLLGWWSVYPLPPDTPSPFNDPEKFGRISAWGYAEILESNIEGVEKGASVYGYLPIGTKSEDLSVIKAEGLKSQLVVKNEWRQHLWPIYNRLQILPPLSELEKSENGKESLGWDALQQGLFGTSYNLSRYSFPWEKGLEPLNPSGMGQWTREDARLEGATVVVLSASGKTGMAWAYCLRKCRPGDAQPRSVVGVCSAKSRDVVEKSGFYDEVVLYEDSAQIRDEIVSRAGNSGEKTKTSKTVLLDFGARPGARERWISALEPLATEYSIPFRFISVAGEVGVKSHEEIMAKFDPSVLQVNASALREKGIETGGDRYFEEFYAAHDEFKRNGGIPGVELKWGKGMEAWREGWEALCEDKVEAGKGLVFEI